ncbi:MAG: hypothetical protein AAF704_16565 [Cyanobacteria bacterium P01_D01_bin.123]
MRSIKALGEKRSIGSCSAIACLLNAPHPTSQVQQSWFEMPF